MTKDKLVELVYGALPYANLIKDLDTTSEPKAIRFTWRGDRFRVSSESLMVEEVKEPFLHGSNLAILAEGIIKSAFVNDTSAS